MQIARRLIPEPHSFRSSSINRSFLWWALWNCEMEGFERTEAHTTTQRGVRGGHRRPTWTSRTRNLPIIRSMRHTVILVPRVMIATVIHEYEACLARAHTIRSTRNRTITWSHRMPATRRVSGRRAQSARRLLLAKGRRQAVLPGAWIVGCCRISWHSPVSKPLT